MPTDKDNVKTSIPFTGTRVFQPPCLGEACPGDNFAAIGDGHITNEADLITGSWRWRRRNLCRRESSRRDLGWNRRANDLGYRDGWHLCVARDLINIGRVRSGAWRHL